MTKQNEIARIALGCGFELKELDDGTMGLRPYVYEFAEKIMAAEREACAKVCYERFGFVGDVLAEIIRARGAT